MKAKREQPEKDLSSVPPQTPEKDSRSASTSPLSSPPPSEDLAETPPASPPSTPSPSKSKLVVYKGWDSSDTEDDIHLSNPQIKSATKNGGGNEGRNEVPQQQEQEQVSDAFVLYDFEPEDTPAKNKGVATSGRRNSFNGRATGRKLIPWHRPRMTEKLLLHLVYECQRAGVSLPWDNIVERLSPGSSGQSATQFILKLRDQLIVEGHMVPPPFGRCGAPGPKFTRGFIQNEASSSPYVTRKVLWGEHIEDRKESLVEDDFIRGSGQYRRLQAMMARGELSDDTPLPTKQAGQRKRPSADGKAARNTLFEVNKADEEKGCYHETDPLNRLPLYDHSVPSSRFFGDAGEDSDADGYKPDPEWTPRRGSKSNWRNLAGEDEDPCARPRPQSRRSGVVILALGSELLAKFPAGESGPRRSAVVVPSQVAHVFGGLNTNTSPPAKVAGIFGGNLKGEPDFWSFRRKQPASAIQPPSPASNLEDFSFMTNPPDFRQFVPNGFGTLTPVELPPRNQQPFDLFDDLQAPAYSVDQYMASTNPPQVHNAPQQTLDNRIDLDMADPATNFILEVPGSPSTSQDFDFLGLPSTGYSFERHQELTGDQHEGDSFDMISGGDLSELKPSADWELFDFDEYLELFPQAFDV